MSLGGYKFAGYKCAKPENATDAEWALLIHKTKVKAFVAANTASGAGWSYDMTESPDGNYHSLDSVGKNYVTVFKRTNEDTSYTWFAIYTLTKCTKTGTDTDAAKRSLIRSPFNYDQSTALTAGTWASSFIRVGLSQISWNDNLTALTQTNNGSTPLLPVANPGTATNYSDEGYFGNYASQFNNSSNYFGFAIKKDSILIFQGKSCSGTDLCCSVASGHAFDDDEHGILFINTQACGNGATYDESSVRARPESTMSMSLTLCQDDSGNCVVPSAFGLVPEALWTQAINAYPYQAIDVFAVATNSSGIYAKGRVNIDLISANANTLAANVPSAYTTAANGNYIRIASVTSGTHYIVSMNYAYLANMQSFEMLYIGWDPSNPDITQESAWTAYTE